MFKIKFHGNHTPENLREFEFRTRIELDAFKLGLHEGTCWGNYEEVNEEGISIEDMPEEDEMETRDMPHSMDAMALRVASPGELRMEVQRLRTANAALVEALEALYGHFDSASYDEALGMARAALALAKGSEVEP